MDPVIEDFKRQLSAAEGYLELGMPAEAWLELEEIHAELHGEPQILLLRLHVLNKLERWEEATILGKSALKQHPLNGEFYLVTSYATRRCENLELAREILSSGNPVLMNEAIFHYNLACYDCQLGDEERAKAGLQRAIRLDRQFRQTALEDDDLRPLWEWLAGHL